MCLGHLNAFAAHNAGAGVAFKEYNVTFHVITTDQTPLTSSQILASSSSKNDVDNLAGARGEPAETTCQYKAIQVHRWYMGTVLQVLQGSTKQHNDHKATMWAQFRGFLDGVNASLILTQAANVFGSCKCKIRVFIAFYFSIQWGIIILLHNYYGMFGDERLQWDDTSSVPEVHDGDHWHDNIDNEFGTFGESLEEEYDGAGACYSQDGSTFLDLFDADEYTECRVDNLYYLFTSKEEWEVADYLLRLSLSMAAMDEFLKLSMQSSFVCTVYSEWLTGDSAWEMQTRLPRGAIVLSAVLSSDKTNITTMTGARVAHPLLLGLANIRMCTRTKLSSKAFLLMALLPIPKYLHSNQ
ncbi:hypothetical protein EDD22DRAFT_851565 [Suillus occidentalis]|nr:hypothetical protein EDD22DRAFT_851565 [Suillus occidentalis]